MRSRFFSRVPVAAAVAAALLASPQSRAHTAYAVPHADGSPYLVFNVYDKGEAVDEKTTSSAAYTAKDLKEVSAAALAWSEILGGKSANTSPVPVMLFKQKIDNAFAASLASGKWKTDRLVHNK